jgi:hypothetical protein
MVDVLRDTDSHVPPVSTRPALSEFSYGTHGYRSPTIRRRGPGSGCSEVLAIGCEREWSTSASDQG